MPLYEYQCQACDNRFELIQKFSDPPAEACPVCGGAVRKLLSSPAIQFKGSGWYITDYARKGSDGSKAEPGKGQAGKGDAAAKGGGSTDSPGSGTAAKSSSAAAGPEKP
jgi:putative FmdB family regulatory protein